MIVLVDTNILLDVIQRRVPFDEQAALLWTAVEEGRIEGFVSAISFNNIFYVVEKSDDFETAMEAVRLVRRAFKLVPLDEALLDAAIDLADDDLEDAIQAAAAKRAGASFLVTRNAKDFVALGTPTASPEGVLAMIAP